MSYTLRRVDLIISISGPAPQFMTGTKRLDRFLRRAFTVFVAAKASWTLDIKIERPDPPR